MLWLFSKWTTEAKHLHLQHAFYIKVFDKQNDVYRMLFDPMKT